MTEQIPDSFEYEGRNFSIVDVDGDGLFNLIQHGLKPVDWCTACSRGHLCTYKLKHKILYLNVLEICLTAPSFNETEEVKKVYAPNIEGCVPIDTSKSRDSWFEYCYNKLL